MKIHANALMRIPLFTLPNLLLLASVAWMGAGSGAASAQEVVTRVYPLDAYLTSTLTLSKPDHNTSGFGGGAMPGGGGGMGGGGVGGGGMGGGGMGGGGMFRVPDDVLPQFGGVAPAVPQTSSIEPSDILDLIDLHLPEAEEATLSILGTSLWVTTTEAGHKAIDALLKTLGDSSRGIRSVQVDFRIVALPPEESIAFANAAGPAAIEAIANIATASDAAKTSIRCDNHSVGSIASGLKRSYVVNATPVVGGDSPVSRSIGYKPETEEVLLGLFGRVRPRLVDKGDRARIEVALQLTSGADPGEIGAANYTDGGIIDRLELEISSLETTVAAIENQWTLAGITALTNPGSALSSGEALSHMVTIVRWSEVK